LLLPGGKCGAALLDFFLKAFGKSVDELGQIYIFGGLDDLRVGYPLAAEADVAFHRACEKKRILEHNAKTTAQRGEDHVFYIHAVNFDCALLDVVQARE